jgi:hypothetical protein
MNRSVKIILIIIGALVLFGALILAKLRLSSGAAEKGKGGHIADVIKLQNSLKGDSLYGVRDVVYRDSAIVIAVDNPEKPGIDAYFNRKFRLNEFDNINMVYIYQYDSARPLQSVSFDDALMATGKKLGKFQEEWVAKYIDTLDGSCKPLKKYLQSTLPNPESFKNEETVYQPSSIHKMQVVCKFRAKDSLGTQALREVTAVVDAQGNIISSEKIK